MHGLDTLRAGAILMVMVFHEQRVLPEVLEPVGKIGWMGVDLFFVLSGYLIGLQVLRPYVRGRSLDVTDFYRRRIYRILPAYLVVVGLYFLVSAWREMPGISPLWEFLTFTENLFVDYGKNQAFSHVWSLCVEEHFYLVLPFLVLWMMRRPSLRRVVWVSAGVVAVGVATRSWELVHGLRLAAGENGFAVAYIEKIYYPTWCRLDGLLVGVLLAATEVFRPEWWRALARRGHVTMGLGLGLFGVSCWLFRDRFESLYGAAAWSTYIGFPVVSVAFGLMVASSVSENGLLRKVKVPGAGVLAMLAYGLYLTHKEIIHLVEMVWPGLAEERSWGAVAVYLVSCLVGAGLLYGCVERPFMRLRDRKGMVAPVQMEPAI